MARAGKISETSVYDNETGEMTKLVNTASYTIEDEPPYVKLYIADILYLKDMPRRYEALTLALLKRVSYAGDADGLCVSLSKYMKQQICKEIGWKNTISIDNAVQVLIKGEIIHRVARGVYRFNPYLFGRGNWADVKKLRMEIQYDNIKGRSFWSNVEYKSEDDDFWKEINSED